MTTNRKGFWGVNLLSVSRENDRLRALLRRIRDEIDEALREEKENEKAVGGTEGR